MGHQGGNLYPLWAQLSHVNGERHQGVAVSQEEKAR